MNTDTKRGGRQSFPDLARSPWGVLDRGDAVPGATVVPDATDVHAAAPRAER